MRHLAPEPNHKWICLDRASSMLRSKMHKSFCRTPRPIPSPHSEPRRRAWFPTNRSCMGARASHADLGDSVCGRHHLKTISDRRLSEMRRWTGACTRASRRPPPQSRCWSARTAPSRSGSNPVRRGGSAERRAGRASPPESLVHEQTPSVVLKTS